MALLNRAPTDEQLTAFPMLITEPSFQVVRYDAAGPCVAYETLDTFHWVKEARPSDCIWMVPGVTPRRF